MRHLATLGVPPPDKSGGRAASLRFVRDLLLRTLLVSIPLFAVLLLIGAPSVTILIAAAVMALTLLDVLWLTFAIRRS